MLYGESGHTPLLLNTHYNESMGPNFKEVFIKRELINIWTEHQFPNSRWLKLTKEQKLKYLFLNVWDASLVMQEMQVPLNYLNANLNKN